MNARAPRVFKMRVPMDVVAPEHWILHQGLVRWGAWNSERHSSPGLSSVEGMYSRGGRDSTPASTAPTMDLTSMAIERAMVSVPMAPRDLLRLLYVRRYTPYSICRAMRLRYEDFPDTTFQARALVLSAMDDN